MFFVVRFPPSIFYFLFQWYRLKAQEKSLELFHYYSDDITREIYSAMNNTRFLGVSVCTVTLYYMNRYIYHTWILRVYVLQKKIIQPLSVYIYTPDIGMQFFTIRYGYKHMTDMQSRVISSNIQWICWILLNNCLK